MELKQNKELTPKRIVEELNRHIVGQFEAKKAVAVALRARLLRKKVPSDLREEIVPKNILMMGPTGVGKTEIARRLAKLCGAPFIKVEATKYTEIGYVGKDVESIIRDLAEESVKNLRDIKFKQHEKKIKTEVKTRLLKTILTDDLTKEERKILTESFEKGRMDENEIEVEVENSGYAGISSFEMPFQGSTASVSMVQLNDMLGKSLSSGKKPKKMKIKEAKEVIFNDLMDEILDSDDILKEALKAAEEEGIVFIDEIDKIALSNNAKRGEVSREGVQRDLLPLIEGTTVQTKYGNIKTDHILFIASGAFYSSKPSDLSPELQGRFPVRVELKALTTEDMISILTTPEASLIKQYKALLKVEGIELEFTEDGILEIAELATKLNTEIENIGARRLYTLLEKTLHDLMFDAPSMKGKTVNVDKQFVQGAIKDIPNKIDLAKFIL